MTLSERKLTSSDSLYPTLIQVDPEYTFHHPQRGRPRLLSFQVDAWGGDSRLRCTHPIVATFVRCDTDLPRLRFALDPVVPNAQGRIRLAERTRSAESRRNKEQ